MTMIWKVKDLMRTLDRDFEPDQLIAFTIMSEQDVERRLGVSDTLLEAIMVQLMRLVDQGEPVLIKYLEVAHEQALDSLKPATPTTCVCCFSEDVHMCLSLFVDGWAGVVWFCGSCMKLSNLFVDAIPLEVFHGKIPVDAVTPNFRRYLQRRNRVVTWAEFEKGAR